MNIQGISVHRTLAPVLWKTVNRIFLLYEACYRILHRLSPVDDFLYLKLSRYRGKLRIFADGTALHNGDLIGIIHFNNHYLAQVHADTAGRGRRAAYVFAYAMMESMRKLAHELEHNPSFSGLAVISGVTWLKTHGNKVGFESEPLPEGRRKRLLKKHFGLLLYALFPHLAKRESARLEPHRFWLTKNRLLESVTAQDNHVAQRFSRKSPIKSETPISAPGEIDISTPDRQGWRECLDSRSQHTDRVGQTHRNFSETGVFEK